MIFKNHILKNNRSRWGDLNKYLNISKKSNWDKANC